MREFLYKKANKSSQYIAFTVKKAVVPAGTLTFLR